MALSKTYLTMFVVPAAVLFTSGTHAQQSSFAVSVTLHSAPKATAAAQLCPEGRPLNLLSMSGVRVDCPTATNNTTQGTQNTEKESRGIASRPSEVIVTF